MIKLIKFLWKFAPHALIVFGCIGFISGLTAIFKKQPPSAPVGMPLAMLKGTPLDKLPEWIQLDDGFLDWSASYALYKQEKATGTVRKIEGVMVPLTGSSGIEGAAKSETLCLVKLDWEEVEGKFPQVASALRKALDSDGTVSLTTSAFPVSFVPEKGSKGFTFGRPAEVVATFEKQGFTRILAVDPGSKPTTAADGFGILVMAVLMAVGGIFWLRKKRKAAALRAKREAIVNAALSGFQQGLREAVDEAVNKTISQIPSNLPDVPAGNK